MRSRVRLARACRRAIAAAVPSLISIPRAHRVEGIIYSLDLDANIHFAYFMVMTDDEYVETSDVEERSILWVQRPDFKVKHETPTKRRKVSTKPNHIG